MKLLKPNWVSHDGNPIFSVDLHPDGSRFATGGQGDGGSSGKVVVWNTLPVQSANAEQDDKVPKILCVMDNHLACVNCVRWSRNGRYLASGGDDHLIMIWQFAGYGGVAMFGSSENKINSGLSGERWRCTQTLKKHTGDILHLAWSPSDKWLASCSIDNTIVIWNAEKFPETTAVLKGHTSLVKGVTWDPVGTYLASQSDDKSLKVWKTLDWKLETTITKPFRECGATTHILRLDWSPDGGYLVSAHAMNNAGPTTQIIERAGWKTNMDFVGHRKAITCTRFNGRMFRKYNEQTSDQHSLPYTCCAIGSRDRALSVWLTSLRRPLVVVNDLFDDSVMDISWSFSGLSLLCCSWDGSVAYVEFTPKEIGLSLTIEEMNDLHKKTYGKSMSYMSKPLVIENPAMLAIQQKKSESNGLGDSKQPVANPVTPTKYPTKQVEVRTPSGRRRIIPIFVAPQEELGGVPTPFGSSSAFASSSLSSYLTKSPTKTLKSGSDRPMKKSDSSAGKTMSRRISSEKHASTISKPEKDSGGKDAAKEKESNTSRVVTTLNAVTGELESTKKVTGEENSHVLVQQQKKAFLDNRLSEKTKSSAPIQRVIKPSAVKLHDHTTSKKQLSHPQSAKVPSSKQQSSSKPPSFVSNGTQQSKKAGRPPGFSVKRKSVTSSFSSMSPPYTHKKIKKDHRIAMPESSDHQKQHTIPQQSPLSSRLSHSTLPPPVHIERLPPKKLRKTLAVQLSMHGFSANIKLINDLSGAYGRRTVSSPTALHRLCCLNNGNPEWESLLSSPGIAFQASKHMVCVACADQTLHFLSSRSGRQIMPTISVHEKVFDIKCTDWWAMVVFCSASISIWDVKNTKSHLSEKSFLHLMPDDMGGKERKSQKDIIAVNEGSSENEESDNVVSKSALCQSILTEFGLPVFTLANGRSYTYSRDLMTWVLVNSTHGSIENCADYKTSDESDLLRDGILTNLQKTASLGVGASALRIFHSNIHSQSSATLGLLEDRLESCLALNSSSEYRFYLLAYIRHLVNEGLDVRLRECCDEMLGPTHVKSQSNMTVHHSSRTAWKPYILGHFKRSLLRDDILPIIGSNLNLQRLYTEYQDQLDECSVNFSKHS